MNINERQHSHKSEKKEKSEMKQNEILGRHSCIKNIQMMFHMNLFYKFEFIIFTQEDNQ